MNNSTAVDQAIDLFRTVYESSPAYKHFIDSRGIEPKAIKSASDYFGVPMTDKDNYIRKYPFQDRLFGGKLPSDYYMICSSSGTSGEPTFWPRDINIDGSLEKRKEALYEEHFQIGKKKTLCVITFGLGVWTAGMLTAKLSWAAARGNKFTVVTPGINIENTFGLLKGLSPFYDQTLIVGYPPFLSDFVEYAISQKLSLKQYSTKLLYTSEYVSEQWRNEMAARISKTGSRYDVVSFYACSDTGIIGAETRGIIDLLDMCDADDTLCQSLFNASQTPSLVQYDPTKKFIESIDGEIIITANQPMPLIRYNIHDRGGVLQADTVREVFKARHKHTPKTFTGDNYVYIFGRIDAVKLTANIYIEDIKYCLERSHIYEKLTGHFQYGIVKSKTLRNRLKVKVFIKPGESISSNDKIVFAAKFYEHLLEANNDFNMIQSGTKIEPFQFEFTDEPDDTAYKNSKLKYFLKS